MSAASWRAATRIARREAWRHKVRSIVVLALIGLPIFAVTAGDVLYRTWQLTPEQKIDRVLGSASAWVQWQGGGTVQQTPDGPYDGAFGTAGRTQPVPTTAQVQGDLPAGSRVIDFRSLAGTLTFYSVDGLDDATLVGLDYRDPITKGMVAPLAGRAPQRADEVAITSALATDAELSVGDELRVTDPPQTFRITAVIRNEDAPHDRMVYALPAAVAPSRGNPASNSWLVHTPRPLTWTDVQHLDALGFVTLSRQVYLHPPPASAVSFDDGSTSGVGVGTIAAGGLIAGMAVLEVILLAGPAFAVGARRKVGELALLAAVGGGPVDVRRSVLADALVLGSAAGAVAVALGIAAAAVLEPLAEPLVTHLPGTFSPHLLDLLVLVLISVGTALLAAMAPAVQASRLDVVAALGGQRGTVASRRRWPLLGAAVVAMGTAGCFAAASAAQLLASVAVIEIGIIVATPALIGAIARGARWLPPTGRIALRDAGRTRAASTPAVAAVMAAVIGATAAVIAAASDFAQAREQYQQQLPRHDTVVSLQSHPADAHAVTAALRHIVPSATIVAVRTAANSCAQIAGGAGYNPHTCSSIDVDYPGDFYPANVSGAQLPSVIVARPADVAGLYGQPEPRAVAALATGRAVVSTPRALVAGQVRVAVSGDNGSSTIELPAVAVSPSVAPTGLLVPPSLLRRLAPGAVTAGILVSSATSLTSSQRQHLNLALARTGHAHPVYTEYGYHDSNLWVLYLVVAVAAFVAVFAALLATALANLDGRAELIALGAIGASPRTRRVLAMSRAAVIAGLGCVIGATAGLAPAAAWVRGLHTGVVIPWPAIALLVLGIPIVTSLLAGGLTRARLPSE